MNPRSQRFDGKAIGQVFGRPDQQIAQRLPFGSL
jgi:hypothetical protein